MAEYHLTAPFSEEEIRSLRVGDTVYVSGKAFTCRSRLHRWIFDEEHPLPETAGQRDLLIHVGPIMLKEEETWYVDPRSLQSHEEVEATTFSAVITQPPTPQPAEASMILYYNPDGGSYYHADPNCEAVAEKYRPLSGTFMFGQINEPAYADLKCCQRCAAPMRTSR